MTSLVLCSCGLAKHMLTVDGPSGSLVLFECEHCDRPCTEPRCAQCRALSHSAAKPAP